MEYKSLNILSVFNPEYDMKNPLRVIFSLNPFSITFFSVIFVCILFYVGVPILEMIELKSYDLRFISRGVLKPSPQVILAVIDEKSLDTEGRWPWPRTKIARLIRSLSDSGAKVIGFDIGFIEPDENSNIKFIRRFEQYLERNNLKIDNLKRFLEASKLNADYDLILARAIQESKARVVLGYFFHMSEKSLKYSLSEEHIKEQLKRLKNSRYPMVLYTDKNISSSPFISAYAPEANLKVISDAAPSAGYFNMFPSKDGVVRRFPLVINCRGESFMPLSLRSLWEYLDRPPLMIKVSSVGIEGISMGNRFIPTDESGQILINYLGPGNTFPQISIGDILRDKVPKDIFKNKIVIVGATAIGIYDMRNTPFDPVFPGVEIHATVIDNILKNNFLSKPSWTEIYDLLAIIILGFITGFITSRVSPLKGLIIAGALFALHITITQYLFVNRGVWLNMVYPLLVVLLVFMGIAIYHYLIEEKDKRFLHATFKSYLSPELIDQMVQNKTIPELGGEAKIITAYFTDIQSFSTFSELLTPHQLVELLNEYLSEMTDILIKEGGTLDKYEGDAIVAFLGAPMYLPDHALRACKVAVDMQNRLAQLREKWSKEKREPQEIQQLKQSFPPDIWAPEDKWPRIVHNMRMRIGINTGEIVVGNMGSSIRMNYTMMGDAVNLAARLEAGAKQYGIYTAVSEYTLFTEFKNNGKTTRVIDHVEARLIDRVTVVGKTEPVKVYELCAMKGGLTEREKELFKIFNLGMEYYLKMQWDAAIEHFSESLKLERFPDSKITPSGVFLERCMEYKENPPVPPGERWDGVYRMTKK